MSDTFEKLMNGADGGLALLQVLAENSFDSILITDASAEGKIIYANEAFEKLTGHAPLLCHRQDTSDSPRSGNRREGDRQAFQRTEVGWKI